MWPVDSWARNIAPEKAQMFEGRRIKWGEEERKNKKRRRNHQEMGETKWYSAPENKNEKDGRYGQAMGGSCK